MDDFDNSEKEIEKQEDTITDVTVNNEESNENLDTEEKVVEKRAGNTDNVKTDNGHLITYNKKEIKPHKIKNKKLRITLITVSVILVNLIILFGIIACINKFNSKVYKNVYLLGNDMSGKTQDQVIEYLKSKSDDIKTNEKVEILQNDENIYTVRANDFDFVIDIAKTAQNVMDFGRSSNIFKNNFHIISALFGKKQVEPQFNYNDNDLNQLIENIDMTIKDRFVDDTYRVDNEKNTLVIIKGKSGNTIDYNTEKEHIIESLKQSKDQKLELCIVKKEPSMLDAEKVHSEVKRDAKDAYIDESVQPVKLVAEIVGLDFKVEELKAVLEKEENKEEGKSIEFPLNVTQPNKKIADISYALYKDKLAGYTTYFSPSLKARSSNLELALKTLNGKVIMPGETFSYNATLGEFTSEKGYQPASTFVGGREVMEVGGGICQTVSTLYNAALYANLQIVERHQHGLPVGYVPPSRDATVYSPSLDFKFKNNRNYPIKIVTSFSWSGNLNVSIYGTKQENEYEIILSHKQLSTIPFGTTYTYDSGLPKGQQVIISKGVPGYSSEGYITKKLNGVVVSSGVLSKDTYNPQKQIVKIGKKEDPPSDI